MLDYKLIDGILYLHTHTGLDKEINFKSYLDNYLRVGGTGIVGVKIAPCSILAIQPTKVTILVNDIQLDIENYSPTGLKVGRNAYIIEKYSLDMENDKPYFFVCAVKPERPDVQFINVDVLDDNSNIITRFRIDAFTGEYKNVEFV